MTAWHFVLGAYAVTAIAMAVEILAVRARHRAARTTAQDSRPPSGIDPA